MSYGKLTVVLAFTLAWMGPARAADITGKWKTEFDSPIGVQKYTYDFKVDGEKLTGKAMGDVGGEKRESEIKEGKVTSNEVSFVEMLKFQDQDIRIEYKGKISSDEIKFTRQVGDFATEELVAKRVKESDKKSDQNRNRNRIRSLLPPSPRRMLVGQQTNFTTFDSVFRKFTRPEHRTDGQ